MCLSLADHGEDDTGESEAKRRKVDSNSHEGDVTQDPEIGNSDRSVYSHYGQFSSFCVRRHA